MIRRILIAAALLPLGAAGTPARRSVCEYCPPDGEIRLTYLGNAGWEITDGRTVVLVDPFLTQFARWPGRRAAGAGSGAGFALLPRHHPDRPAHPACRLHPDHPRPLRSRTRRPLRSPAHRRHDHRPPRPPPTWRARRMCRSSSLITAIGGEDYDFGPSPLRVIPNIHSALDDKRYFNNGRGIVGTAPAGLRAPCGARTTSRAATWPTCCGSVGHEVADHGVDELPRARDGGTAPGHRPGRIQQPATRDPRLHRATDARARPPRTGDAHPL